MSEKGREWDYWPQPEGEPFTDKDGNEVLGWHPRIEGQDAHALCADFEAFYAQYADPCPLLLRPILTRQATDVECRINGWQEGTFVRCTARAKHAEPMWQIEVDNSHA